MKNREVDLFLVGNLPRVYQIHVECLSALSTSTRTFSEPAQISLTFQHESVDLGIMYGTTLRVQGQPFTIR
jgi:hypothetical protein